MSSPSTNNEVRFALFKTSDEPIRAKGGPEEYYNWLNKYLNKKSALHFYYYIYHLDLSHVDIDNPPNQIKFEKNKQKAKRRSKHS